MTRSRTRPLVLAAVDIGSYSVHLLVGRVTGRRIDELADESAFLGLGRSLDVSGGIGGALPELILTLQRYLETARLAGSEVVTIVGTDPLRRAADAGSALQAIQVATGIEVSVLSHEEEAIAALLGATLGREPRHDLALVDVGGGSTEVLFTGPERSPIALGLPLGATRLSGTIAPADPPDDRAIAAMCRAAADAFRHAPDISPAELIAVGGTARSLLKIGPPLASRELSRRRIRAALRLLGASPSTDIAERFAVRPSRARVLPAGAAILVSAMERYQLERLRVARGGLREGLLLATAASGSAWRKRLPSVAPVAA